MSNRIRKSKVSNTNKILKVVKYVRVSTDEQKLKKNSILAQHEILDAFIAQNDNLELVGTYADEGVSGTKFMRTDLQRLLADVEKGGIDLILVTKLDRWFRDVALYYKTQEILDAHNAAWYTVLEDYETLTSDGRFKVNIMLSVYQNEVDRTSERIGVVFDYKVKQGHAISGAQPYGFCTERRDGYSVVVKDPDKVEIVNDFLDYLETHESVRGALNHINVKYDLAVSYNTIMRLVKSPLLYGEYRDNKNYCEGYISKDRALAILDKLNKRHCKVNHANRVYPFSGLLKCPCCGRNLVGATQKQSKHGKQYEYKVYRCNSAKLTKKSKCSYISFIWETQLERLIWKELRDQFSQLEMEIRAEQETAPKPKKINKKAIEEEMGRLNTMYKKGRINEDEYDREYEALENKLKQNDRPAPAHDLSKTKELLSTDIESLYKTFTAEEKRLFWRSIIDWIDITDRDKPIIHFL